MHQADKPWERQTKEAEILILPDEVVFCGKMVSTGYMSLNPLTIQSFHLDFLLWFWDALAPLGYNMVSLVGLTTKSMLTMVTLASWFMRRVYVSLHMSHLNDFLH